MSLRLVRIFFFWNGGWDRLHYTWIDIGTPNVSFMVALDAGSDLLWVPCDCINCAPFSATYYNNTMLVRSFIYFTVFVFVLPFCSTSLTFILLNTRTLLWFLCLSITIDLVLITKIYYVSKTYANNEITFWTMMKFWILLVFWSSHNICC